MQIAQLVSTEPGWRAVFREPDGSESLSRILAWAIAGSGAKGELVGLIVDPGEPSRIVATAGAVSPGGGTFVRYRYVAPEPPPVAPPTPPAAAAPAEDDTAEQLAKKFLKRRR